MYNLNVCQLTDLGAVPNSVQGPWPKNQLPGWPSQKQPCTCMSDAASITIDGTTSYFRDFAGDTVTDQLNSQISKSSKFAGKTTGTCYVSYQGEPDCDDYPLLCYNPGDIIS